MTDSEFAMPSAPSGPAPGQAPVERVTDDPMAPEPWVSAVAAPRPGAKPLPEAPQDLLAERTVLGSIVYGLDDALTLVRDQLKPADFYDPRHVAIWRAILDLSTSGSPIDPLSVLAWMREHRQMPFPDQASAFRYVHLDLESYLSVTSIEYHAKRIIKLSAMRRVIQVAMDVQRAGMATEADPDEFLDMAATNMGQALVRDEKPAAQAMSEIVSPVYQQIIEAKNRGGGIVGQSTGFLAVDRLVQGLQRTDLVVLAARPAMGKSALAMTIALNIAKAQEPVLAFSLEMGKDQLVQRLLAAEARVPLTALRQGEFSVDDEVALRDAAGTLWELPLYIDDQPALTPVEVASRAKRLALQLRRSPRVIIIDYMQLMAGGVRGQTREQEIGHISRSLKGLAKDLNCTVLALSQLNRSVESRGDKRPLMSDLRESGSIEQDADQVWFIYRDEVYNKESPSHLAELIVSKQRSGPTGTVKLHFDGKLTRFIPWTESGAEPY